MGCGTITLKSCLGLISLFFWTCAVVLIVIGALVLAAYDEVADLAEATEIITPAAILIGAGIFLFIIGLVGCFGGMKSNKVALTLFFILTVVVLVGEVVAVAIGYQYRVQAGDKLTDELHYMIRDCANNNSQTYCDEVDFIQTDFKCCGADTYKDWYNYSAVLDKHPIPQSCCITENCQTPARGTLPAIVNKTIYTQGCAPKAVDEVEKYFAWIFVATVTVVILQVLSLVATCIMLFRSAERPYLILDSQGYRV